MRTKYFIETEEKAKPYHSTRYHVEPLEKAAYKNKGKFKNLNDFLAESGKVRTYAGFKSLYAPLGEDADQTWKPIEDKHQYLYECLDQLKTAAEVIKHFQYGHKVSYFSKNQHAPIADLEKTHLPSKYIVMRFSDSKGKPLPKDHHKEILNYPLAPLRPEDVKTTPEPLEYPLDAVNRVELRKAINTAAELQHEIRSALERKIRAGKIPEDVAAANLEKLDSLDASITKHLKHASVFFHIDEIEKPPISKRSSADHGRG